MHLFLIFRLTHKNNSKFIFIRCKLYFSASSLPGQTCSQGQTCLGRSNCIGNVCTCPENHVIQNYECRLSQTIGLSLLKSKIIVFLDFFLVLGEIGMPCDSMTMCLGGSSCTNRLCTCPSGYMVENGVCLPARGQQIMGANISNYLLYSLNNKKF